MQWNDIRRAFPQQWLVVEAVEAHSDSEHRILDKLAVLETCPDGLAAFHRYRDLHRQSPQRELYYLHTKREKLEIREIWMGPVFTSATAGATARDIAGDAKGAHPPATAIY